MLDVGSGQQVYWETVGNPDGLPALFVHGGPGSGCNPGQRRFFDPAAYRGVLFDQRGCGRSRPLVSNIDVDLSVNTTLHLIADMERLRGELGIDRWLLLGSSWGVDAGARLRATVSRARGRDRAGTGDDRDAAGDRLDLS